MIILTNPASARTRECGSTVVVLPDLQNYTGRRGRYLHVLEDTMAWIIRERKRLGIELVVQVGDLTDSNKTDEWKRARRAFSVLDGVLPYVVTVGNHDLGFGTAGSSRSTFLNKHFHLADNPLNKQCLVEAWREGCLENTASVVTLGRKDWLILALEFGPREGVLRWANKVLRDYPDHPTLIVTHEYIDQLSLLRTGRVQHSRPETYNSPYAYGLASDYGGVNCGEEIWMKLVAAHPQVRAVVCGHHRPFKRNWFSGRCRPVAGLASAHRIDYRPDGSRVDQLMFNAQWAERGGDGWVMLLHASTDGASVKSRKFMTPRVHAEW